MNKQPAPQKNDSSKTFLSVAITFFACGLTLMISESTRMTGLPFVIIAITFFIISQDKSDKTTKK